MISGSHFTRLDSLSHLKSHPSPTPFQHNIQRPRLAMPAMRPSDGGDGGAVVAGGEPVEDLGADGSAGVGAVSAAPSHDQSNFVVLPGLLEECCACNCMSYIRRVDSK